MFCAYVFAITGVVMFIDGIPVGAPDNTYLQSEPWDWVLVLLFWISAAVLLATAAGATIAARVCHILGEMADEPAND